MKKYNIIYADPPWQYNDHGVRGGVDDHYETMTLEEIKKLPINNLSEDNSILFLWVTYPMIQEGLDTIKSWGFQYKTIGFQWIKKNRISDSFFFGLGRYTRGNTECCLIGVKGKLPIINKGVSQLIISKIREHSQKPDEAREKIIKLLGDLPRIELFARTKINGWDIWGNELLNDINMDDYL